MSERVIKFRRPVFEGGKFTGFHYWGYIDNSFVGPMDNYSGGKRGRSEQFTGKLDKNGKEIYEGDRVNYIVKGDHQTEWSGVVRMSVEIGQWCVDNGDVTWEPLYDALEHYEVIGNVHDTQEAK